MSARIKRQKYLEAAMIMNRLLDSRYFPDVLITVEKGDKGKGDFNKICKKLEIPDGMLDPLWKTFLEAKTAEEPGWII